jgi:hypothetical protein
VFALDDIPDLTHANRARSAGPTDLPREGLTCTVRFVMPDSSRARWGRPWVGGDANEIVATDSSSRKALP